MGSSKEKGERISHKTETWGKLARVTETNDQSGKDKNQEKSDREVKDGGDKS